MPTRVPWAEKLAALEEYGDDPSVMSGVIDAQRTKGLGDQSRLAELDRFSQFANMARQDQPYGILSMPLRAGIGTALAAGYEASKLYPPLTNAIGRTVNTVAPGWGDQFRVDQTTSKPSIGNVLSALQGYISGSYD
jgi:hypothetical protein